MTHLLRALDLGWIMWVVGVDGKGEFERAGLVHAFVRLNSQGKVENVGRIRKVCAHRFGQLELGQVYQVRSTGRQCEGGGQRELRW